MKRKVHRSVLRIRNGSNGSRGCASPLMSALASTSAPQSGHVAGRGRQPHVDDELRLTAKALPRHRLPTLRRRRRQMRPQQPPHTHLSSARRSTSFVPATDSSQPRTSPASSAQRFASIGAMTLHSAGGIARPSPPRSPPAESPALRRSPPSFELFQPAKLFAGRYPPAALFQVFQDVQFLADLRPGPLRDVLFGYVL